MSLLNVILLSQIAGYSVALILSLCMVVPMVLHESQFKGQCLLFSTGEWSEENGQFIVRWASQAYCNTTTIVGIILFLMATVQVYRMSLFMHKGTDSSFLSAFIDVIASIVLCIMALIAALMITFGFLVWCKNMTARFPSCEIAAGKEIDLEDDIDTSWFYIEMGTAQFGAWASWACWVGLSVFAMLKLCRYHQLQNMRVSMYRERQRLINDATCQGRNEDEEDGDGEGAAPVEVRDDE